MAGIITRMMKARCVYWQRLPGTDNFGQYMYAFPVEIRCRWEDAIKEFVGPHRTTELSQAIVYVDRDMQPGDKLFNGLLSDLESSSDSNDTNDTSDSMPEFVKGALEIRAFHKLPDLKYKQYLRTCYL